MSRHMRMPAPLDVATERDHVAATLRRRQDDASTIGNLLGLMTHSCMLLIVLTKGLGDIDGWGKWFHLAGIASCLVAPARRAFNSVHHVLHSLALVLFYSILLRHRIVNDLPEVMKVSCLFTAVIMGTFATLVCPFFNTVPALMGAAMLAMVVWAARGWDAGVIPVIASGVTMVTVVACQRLLAIRIVQEAHLVLKVDKETEARIASERAAIAKDLEIAAGVQNLLLPKRSSFQARGLELSSHYQSASEAGGDWWWFDEQGSGRYRLFVGDVTGHGAGAAMITAMVAGTYRGLGGAKAKSLDLMRAFDKSLCDVSGGEYMMTMAIVEIDVDQGRMAWFTAGAPPFFLIDAEGKVTPMLQPSSPLGTDELTIGQGEMTLVGRTRIVVMTDGVLDFQPATRISGRRAVRHVLGSMAETGHFEAHLALLLEIRRFLGEARADDVTVVSVDVRDAARSGRKVA